MSDLKKQKISNIIQIDDYLAAPEKFNYLFEVQLPPEDIKLWKPRVNYSMGTPLIGDLYLNLEEEKLLEIHPFPEWVVQLYYPAKVNSKAYLVVPKFSKSLVRKFRRKSIDERIELIQNEINSTQIQDLLGFEYKIGINIMVPAFIPHFFISSHIDEIKGDKPPYLQVFEPELSYLTKNLNIKTTYYFQLPYKASI